MENLIHTITNVKAKAQQRTLYGRPWLVAPMTLIVPGVLNGSQGPLYYPKEEVSKYPENWNHKPITVNHPQAGGSTNPDVLNNVQIGFVLNSRIENGNLVADGWFDVYRLSQVDGRILNKLKQGETVELSTGLGIDRDDLPEEKTHNDKSYKSVAKNYRPDHLAILPDTKGACSIKDGCGVLVNSKGEEIHNELSFQQVHDLIARELRSKFTQDEPRPYIVATYPTFFVYEKQGKLFQRAYQIKNNKIELGEQEVEVIVEKEFKPVSNANDSQRENNTMADEKLVKELISNCDCWSQDDEEILNNLTDEKIQSLIDSAKKHQEEQEVANAATEGFEDQRGDNHKFNPKTKSWETVENKSKEEDKKEEPKVENQEPKKLSAADWYDQAPPEVQEVVKNAKEIIDNKRNSLIDQIVNHYPEDEQEQTRRICENTKDEGLETWLRGLPKTNNQNPFATPDYSGAVGGVSNTEEIKDKPEPLGMPVWDFS